MFCKYVERGIIMAEKRSSFSGKIGFSMLFEEPILYEIILNFSEDFSHYQYTILFPHTKNIHLKTSLLF